MKASRALLTLSVVAWPIAAYDQLYYVDQLIGSRNGGKQADANNLQIRARAHSIPGNVFAGASLPYGMAKAVADTDSVSDQGGFTSDHSKVTGFSSLHDSGTGGSPSLGNFQLFPYASCTNDTVDGCVFMKDYRATNYHGNSVKASPGYFALTLESGVMAEMTTTAHTALYRFTFPASSEGGSPLILLDLTDLSNSRQDNATIDIDKDTGRMKGHGRFLPSFGTGNYVAYFCVDFKGPHVRDGGIWVNSRGSDQVQYLKISRGINSAGPLPGGGFVRFDGHEPVTARVGLSFQSVEQACSVAETEIPNFDLDETRANAVRAWKEKLSPITVSRNMINGSLLKNFYSGIYRTVSACSRFNIAAAPDCVLR